MAKKISGMNFTQNITKMLEKAVNQTAQDVLIEIEKSYEDTIEQFYKHYSPTSRGPYRYNRTMASFYGSSGYNALFSKNNYYYQNGIPIVGIDVSPSYLPGHPYQAEDTDWVFRRTFEEGIHGFTLAEARVWSKKNHTNRFGKKSRFRMPNHIPSQMSASPKVLMDKRFKEISSINNLNKIFNKNVAKLLI